jgi:hypothetical protein
VNGSTPTPCEFWLNMRQPCSPCKFGQTPCGRAFSLTPSLPTAVLAKTLTNLYSPAASAIASPPPGTVVCWEAPTLASPVQMTADQVRVK